MKKKFFIFVILIFLIPNIIMYLNQKEKVNSGIIKNKIPSSINVRVKREALSRIDTVPLEDYVLGVVSGEMPITFAEEALKAQAVCARSYVIRKLEQNKSKEYDVVDTISNQVYQDNEQLKKKWKKNYETYYQKLKKVVKETEAEYMTYDGKVIEAFFFSTSNGHTENSEEVFTKKLPYLRSVDSSWDKEVSPVFQANTEMSLSDFYTKLDLPYQKTLTYKILEKTEAGSIKKIKINGKEMKGTEVRQKLGIRSTYFSFQVSGSNIKIQTQGYGHGVGMSQYGALAMAKKGYSYDEILKYYYQGIEISKIF